jgi:signal transduction histidine kinase
MEGTEVEAWHSLSHEAFPAFVRAVDDFVGRRPAADATVEQAALDRLTVATARVADLLERLAALNAEGLDSTGREVRSAVSTLVLICIVLGIVGTGGGVLLVRWALAAVREYDRSTSERLAELDDFAGRVAHDLRNPLQNIGMSLAIIHKRSTDESLRTTVARAQDGARRMGAFIQELLEFARSGAKPVPGASASVLDVLRDVAEDFAEGAEERHVHLSVQGPEDLRAAITPEALRAIVANLTDNAVKHMAPVNGGPCRVELVADESQRAARIDVRDTGVGISPDVLPHLFEPFFRGATRSGGFGIGLKTVKRIVDAYGGTIAVESIRDRGTVFTVTLPLSSSPPADVTTVAASR